MTEKSYPRLEDGVVIYEPPASEGRDQPHPDAAPAAKPPSRGRRARHDPRDEADED